MKNSGVCLDPECVGLSFFYAHSFFLPFTYVLNIFPGAINSKIRRVKLIFYNKLHIAYTPHLYTTFVLRIFLRYFICASLWLQQGAALHSGCSGVDSTGDGTANVGPDGEAHERYSSSKDARHIRQLSRKYHGAHHERHQRVDGEFSKVCKNH